MAEDDTQTTEQSLLDQGDTPRRRRRGVAQNEAEAVSEQVTYRPGPQDPASIKWRGRTFHANTPVTITDAEHVEAARGNKFFKVGEFSAADAVAFVDHVPLPKTSEQYRAWVVGWLPKVSSEGELDHKWMSEEALRQACGVGTDDLEWLNTLIAPKRSELHKAGFTS